MDVLRGIRSESVDKIDFQLAEFIYNRRVDLSVDLRAAGAGAPHS